jgi:ABC-2 type transport system ATP-binding protein
MLELSNLSKIYSRKQRPAIDDVTISVSPHEVLGLVGLNGAGKTTTIRLASGVIHATAGRVVVDGRDMRSEKALASTLIGWVPEAAIHDSSSGIGTLIRYYAGLLQRQPIDWGERLLEEWGVWPLAARKFRTLSLGERKRFSIAVACLQDPRYYLLDEVFNGLDPIAVAQVRQWILDRKRAGCGILLSSHQLREVQALADRIAVLHQGRIVTIISSGQIPTSQKRRLSILLTNPGSGVVNILRDYGEVEQRGSLFVLTGEGLDAPVINRRLVEEGCLVSRLDADEPDLETYFLNLIQGRE